MYKILEYVGIDVGYRRGKTANSDIPMNIFYGKDETEVEDITTTLVNTALFLYLFFDKNKKFEMAHIAGDKHVVDFQANDVVIAFMNYIACFFVFNIGFGREFSQCLGFFQQVFFQLPYTEGAKSNMFIENMKKFANATKAVAEGAQFKKLCV